LFCRSVISTSFPDYGGVEIREAIDLRSTQKANVDAAARQPVREDLT
jgi:hypothetical protein